MDRSLFEDFRRLIYEKSGIALRDGKESLVLARIGKRIRALGLADAQAYFAFLKDDGTGNELVHFLDVISTNVTRFFREPVHLEIFRTHVHGLLAQKRHRLRFWSAGCSTGDEPYSLAMILSDLCPPEADWKILGTDLSSRVLTTAREGVYPFDHLRELSQNLLDRFFSREPGLERWQYRLDERVRQRVVFKRINLAHPPFPMTGPLDAIFCRNVMIYFDNEVRLRLLREFHRLLAPDALLFIGLSESLAGLDLPFRVAEPSVYRRIGVP
jgi:chemotaxis protein methyltransferase CheR